MSLLKSVENKKDIYSNRLLTSLDKKLYQTNIGNVSIKEAKRIVDSVDYKYNKSKRILMNKVDNLYKPMDMVDTGSHLDSKTKDLLRAFKLERTYVNGSVRYIHGPNSILSSICNRRIRSYHNINIPKFLSMLDEYLSFNIDKLTLNTQRILLKQGKEIYLDSGSLRDYIYADDYYKYFNKFNKSLINRFKLSDIYDLVRVRDGVIDMSTKYLIYEFLTTSVFIGDGLIEFLLRRVLGSTLYTTLEKEKMFMHNNNYLDLLCITSRNALLSKYKTNLGMILGVCSKESRVHILKSIETMKII